MSIFLATCGPTGVGKTYHMQRLIRSYPQFFTPILSVTTRPSRGKEDEEWYRFITPEEVDMFESEDIVSHATFRGEHYLLLRSEIDRALARAPVAFMAVIPSVILLMREKQIQHSIICCRIGDVGVYERHLQQRGYEGEKLTQERETGLVFSYPPSDPAWPQRDVLFQDDKTDEKQFDQAVKQLSGGLVSFLG